MFCSSLTLVLDSCGLDLGIHFETLSVGKFLEDCVNANLFVANVLFINSVLEHSFFFQIVM